MRKKNPLLIIILRFFGALPFAIFYSSIQLYLLSHHFPAKLAVPLVGNILALSFGLSLVGGYLANRYINLRNFFVFSMITQTIGCFAFACTNLHSLILLSGFYLLGSTGINVSINMLITRLYSAEDYHREKSFFWIYASLNLGYFIGYSLSGYCNDIGAYAALPLVMIILTVITLFITIAFWNKLKSKAIDHSKKGLIILFSSLIGVYILSCLLLNSPNLSNTLIIIAWIVTAFWMLNRMFKDERCQHEKHRILLFYVLLLSSLIFWSIYFIAPMATIVFIKNSVDLNFHSYAIAPQWVQNINTLIMIVGSIIIGLLLKANHISNKKIVYMAIGGILFLALGIACLPIGISLTPYAHKMALDWVILSYILQSAGELLIGPIGFSLVGRLIPQQYHNMMMGIWVTLLGIASAISSKLSAYAPYNNLHKYVARVEYSDFFVHITAIALIAAIAIAIFYYFLPKQPQHPDSLDKQ